MKRLLSTILLFISLIGFGQNVQLAKNYFDKGEFEKALLSYEEILQKQPNSISIIVKVVECHQQMLNYELAEKLLKQKLSSTKQSQILVELGYNFKLQKNEKEATKNYDLAIASIEKNPGSVYSIAQNFEKKGLYEHALKSFETAQSIDSKLNFNYQVGVLYGQLGRTDHMIEKFLDESYNNQGIISTIQNQFVRFINDNPDENFTNSLRKALIIRAQKNQDVFWNSYLSWFYINQKEYSKAFVQEKAVYKRNPDSFHSIVNLAVMAIEDNDTESAHEIIAFVLENSSDVSLQIYCHSFLIKNRINENNVQQYASIQADLELLIKKYGVNPNTVPLQIILSNFLTFNLKQPEKARNILQKTLELPLNEFEKAQLKMELGDIYLYEEKFNQATITYTQIEDNLKNNAIGHEASLKAAKTSYFKGDFDWALNQFKVLKSATSQLIANDALEYFLLINDNKVADSTMIALKKFSKADYLIYQNRNEEAIDQFKKILIENSDNEIISVTLLRLAMAHEKIGKELEALDYFQKIIDHHNDGIYIDEAYYFSAEIYLNSLKNKEKAKALYETILFNHQDSIYYIDAQKKYRQIRGDFDS